ncbi:MAG: efflux RND transporter permease subunit [Lachnospiraceae bacterium]|nr:efflux RND transporter permease subunit [Lachnospiraceae bacterium]
MISKFSVKKSYTVLVAVVMVIVLGVVSFTKMSTDLLPNINLPYVVVMTTYVGASPETVETVVTKPVESSMATVSNIENITSVSNENYSMVVLEFSQNANMDSVSLEIREKLDQIKGYWDDSVGNPLIMKLNPDMMPVMIAAVGEEGCTNAQISELTEQTIIPRLESIEGVASASATGLIEESVQVVIRQDKIDAINEQVFGSIDEQLADAQKEINDGRKEIADGEAEIADNIKDLEEAKQKIEDGKKEISDKENELENGEQELAEKKEDTEKQISEGMTKLIDAKSKIASNIATLNLTLKQMKTQMDAAGLDVSKKATMEQAKQMCDQYAAKETYDMTDYAVIASLLGKDITEVSSMGDTEIRGALSSMSASLQTGIDTINQYEELQKTVSDLTAKEAEIDKKIEELTKGQIEAAAGFGSADATLTFGKTQLESAKTQLETSQDQLESGQKQIDAAKEQMEDAKKQLDDAQEQLADSKEQAYNSADMNGILTVENVKALLSAQNFSMPAGYVTEEGVEYLVRVGDKPDDVETLKSMPIMNVNMDGVDVIMLGDVADVFMTDNSGDIYTNVNGAPGVLLQIQKQTGYSTGDVSKKINKEFEEMQEEDENLILLSLMDQGIYIDLVMNSILSNILQGAVLAVLILILFLKDLRPTVVIAVSIPISLVTAIVCMYFSGITLNIISLSGLALGIGMLVDNSIVVIENIYRLRNEGVPMKEAAIRGASEVGSAIIASTLTTICVFAPIVFTEGITRQLFVDMGLTIAFSLVASLLVALTVVPAMASKTLTKIKPVKENGLYRKMVAGYEKLLRLALRFKPVVLIGVIALFVISAVLSVSRGTAFMPQMDSTQISVSIETPNGTPLGDTAAISDEVVERIRAIEEVEDVGAMAGLSSMEMLTGAGSGDTNSISMYVTLKEEKEHTAEEIGRMIAEATTDIENAEITVNTDSMDMSALGGSGITIQVRGRDLDTIQKIASDVADIVSGVEGTAEVSDGMTETTGELRIKIDRDKAMDYGLTVAQVFSQINAKVQSAQSSSELTTDTKDYDIYVINQADDSMTRDDIRNMTIEYTDKDKMKQKVALSEIATFEEKEGMTSINREDQTRYVAVSAAIADGYNVGFVADDVNKALKNYEVPKGYSLVFSGENETINDAMKQVILMLVLALILMFLIMVAQFQSLLSPFIIMFTIPLAFTGGFLGLYVTGSEVSVIALIGFVMLSGIIVNNGIVLVDYINQLRAGGMEKKEAILEAGRTRLRPVLMTALTTILALSTMVFSREMGADMARPMAIVTTGGLVYGTLLTLFVVPCIYDIFNREKKKKREDGYEGE